MILRTMRALAVTMYVEYLEGQTPTDESVPVLPTSDRVKVAHGHAVTASVGIRSAEWGNGVGERSRGTEWGERRSRNTAALPLPPPPFRILRRTACCALRCSTANQF